MKVTVQISPSNKTTTVDISKKSTVEDVARKINLKPDGIIVLRKNSPIPIDDIVCSDDHLHIIKVASGG